MNTPYISAITTKLTEDFELNYCNAVVDNLKEFNIMALLSSTVNPYYLVGDLRRFNFNLNYKGHEFKLNPTRSGDSLSLYYQGKRIGMYTKFEWIFNNIEKTIK